MNAQSTIFNRENDVRFIELGVEVGRILRHAFALTDSESLGESFGGMSKRIVIGGEKQGSAVRDPLAYRIALHGIECRIVVALIGAQRIGDNQNRERFEYLGAELLGVPADLI